MCKRRKGVIRVHSKKKNNNNNSIKNGQRTFRDISQKQTLRMANRYMERLSLNIISHPAAPALQAESELPGKPSLAPLSMEFSGQEYWSGLLCPFPGDLLGTRIQPMTREKALPSGSSGLPVLFSETLLGIGALPSTGCH